jgi:F420-non-reducing hydrogenase iron-sulfur subunit
MTPAKTKSEKAETEKKTATKAKVKAPPKKRRAAAKANAKRPSAKSAGTAKAKARAGTKKAAASRKRRVTKPKAGEDFTPRIVVFACNWCSYAGADTAGISRIQYSPHFRIIRVMCSGRVHPAFVLRAFELGADGVLVSGCHFGDCHYIFGNERAVEQFEKTKRLLKLLGVEEGRVRLEWISAAEGVKFGRVIDEFVEQVRALGPSKLAPPGRSLPREAEAYADAAALAK